MKKQIRNLIIFAVATLGCGFVGMFLDRLVPAEDPMKGLGVLLWLATPLAANLLLRALGRDGWKDLGLRPHFKDGWIWYLTALLIVPLVVLVTLGLGVIFGAVSLSGFAARGFGALQPLIAAAFVGAVVKNIFEEFAWRGYLTPRFEAIKLHPFLSSLLTGLIWAGWHIPYYLYFLDPAELRAHTSLELPVFIILAFLVLPFHALAYGELRLLSKSVWPAWLLHTVANGITLPLLSAGFVTLRAGIVGAALSPGTEGIVHSLLMGLVGLGLYFYRRGRTVLK